MSDDQAVRSPTDDVPPASTGRNALVLAAGTVVSRFSGFARILVLPAIFGASAIGDMFVAVNALPLTLFATFGGQALTSLLVPVLVRSKLTNAARSRLIGERALGIVSAVLVALVAVGLVAHRWIAGLLALGIDSLEQDPTGIAAVLLLIMLPQVVLYGAIAVLVAIQHARGSFLLPSFAPTVENIGVIVAVVLVARAVPDIHLTDSSDTGVLVALGLGSTLALLLHVALQAFGTWRTGAGIVPRRPAREPELTALREQVKSNLAWTLLAGPRSAALVIAAGWAGVGGIQAMQIAYIVQNLPMAIVGYPVAAASLPAQSRHEAGSPAIAAGYTAARNIVLWIVAPLGVSMIVLADPLSQILALGRFGEDDGARFIAYAAIGLGIAAASEAVYEVARQTSLAIDDLRGFTRSVWFRAVVSLLGIPLMPVLFDGAGLLLALGLVLTVADAGALALINHPLASTSGSVRSLRWMSARVGFALSVGAAAGWMVAEVASDTHALVRLVASGATLVVAYSAVAWLISQRGSQVRADVDLAFSGTNPP